MVLPEPCWAAAWQRGAITIAVSGNDPADGSWLEAFLPPWCAPADVGEARLSVRLTRSDALSATLDRAWTARPQPDPRPAPIPCVRLDTRTIALEPWQDGSLTRLHDAAVGCHFAVGGAHVELVAAAGERRAPMILLGVVREMLAAATAATRPTLDLHAAAFAACGGAILVAGRKGAGKTSLLCHAALTAPTALIANDRVLVHLDRARPVAVGIPTMASIRAGTLALFPRLLDAAEAFPAACVPPPSPGEDGASPDDGALLLPPAGFAGRLGIDRIAEAPLDAILLPALRADVDGWTLERLAPEVALPELTACLYGAAADRDRPTLFGALAAGRGSALPPMRDLLRRIVAGTPLYRCHLGPNAYARPATALLAALGQAAGRR